MSRAKAVNDALRRLRANLPRHTVTGPDTVEDLITLINAAVENHAHRVEFDAWGKPSRAGGVTLASEYPFKVSGGYGDGTEAVPGREHTGEGVEAVDSLPEDWTVTRLAQEYQAAMVEVERLGRLIAEWWSDCDNPPTGVVPIAERWRPDLFGPVREAAPVPAPARPGKEVPSPSQVCTFVGILLAEAGFPGYAPLSVDEGVAALANQYRVVLGHLEVAKAEARQYREAYSHRTQIAEHYRQALGDLHRSVREVVVGTEHGHALNDALMDANRAYREPPEWDKRLRS